MRFRLADHGTAFSTRPKGCELLSALEAARGEDVRIEVDFAGARHISYSFADEFVGTLLQRVSSGAVDAEVSLENVPPLVVRLIEASVRRRGLPDRAADLAAVAPCEDAAVSA